MCKLNERLGTERMKQKTTTMLQSPEKGRKGGGFFDNNDGDGLSRIDLSSIWSDFLL